MCFLTGLFVWVSPGWALGGTMDSLTSLTAWCYQLHFTDEKTEPQTEVK